MRQHEGEQCSRIFQASLINDEQVRQAHESDRGKDLLERRHTVPLSVTMPSLFEAALENDDAVNPPPDTNAPESEGRMGKRAVKAPVRSMEEFAADEHAAPAPADSSSDYEDNQDADFNPDGVEPHSDSVDSDDESEGSEGRQIGVEHEYSLQRDAQPKMKKKYLNPPSSHK
jgi:hypothetical protein